MTDAPHILDGYLGEGPLAAIGFFEAKHAVERGVFLGDAVGELGEGFGGGDADAGGNVGALQDFGADVAGIFFERAEIALHAVEAEKRFVDGIHFDFGGDVGEVIHDAAAHVAVEGVVAAEYLHLVLFDEGASLEQGLAHFESNGLGFGGAGDDAPVVVAEDDNGHAVEGGLEGPLATDVEVVAID